jgi:hypothetical protein
MSKTIFFERKTTLGTWYQVSNSSNPSSIEISIHLKNLTKMYSGPLRAVDEQGRIVDMLM